MKTNEQWRRRKTLQRAAERLELEVEAFNAKVYRDRLGPRARALLNVDGANRMRQCISGDNG